MNNFKKYGLLLSIIFSVLLHLIIIENFSFKIIQSDKQGSFDDKQFFLGIKASQLILDMESYDQKSEASA